MAGHAKETRKGKNGGKVAEELSRSIMSLPLRSIDSGDQFRIRKSFDGIEALAQDIKANGQHCPMFVRKNGQHGYELISGFRRLQALNKLKATTGLVRVYKDLSVHDAYRLAVSENVQRNDLTPLEKAMICLKLKTEGMNKPDIAKLVFPNLNDPDGRTVANYLTIATADERIRDTLSKGRIGFSQALALADALKSKKGETFFKEHPKALDEVLGLCAKEDLSVRQVKEYLDALFEGNGDSADKPEGHGRRSRSPNQPIVWKDSKRGGWSLRVNFNPGRLREDKEALDELEKGLAEALEKVREWKKNKGDDEKD